MPNFLSRQYRDCVASTVEISAAEYRAATQGAGYVDRSDRGKLALSGPEAITFLDSLLSQDIAAIAPGTGADATLLDHKGHMLAEVRVLRTEDELLLDCERVALQALFDALNGGSLGWKVNLHKRTLECGLVSVIGPQATGAPAQEHAHVLIDGVRHIRTRLGVDLLCAAEELARVKAALDAAPIGEEVYECVRIEAAIPRYGIELDATTMPQEAGLHERAVSYTKGCYVGQETVARLYWKGRPNRHLRRLTFSEPVPTGATLWLGEREVGSVASSTVSPRLGPIGLAIVRREAEPGAQLRIEDGPASATVGELS
jgi:folate-binding protein YgfZ